VLRVERVDAGHPQMEHLKLVHGHTLHGVQFQAPESRRTPTAYFARQSGIGVALRALAAHRPADGLQVGIVGLGVGTIAAYAERGDRFVFYEIDPKVKSIAQENFSFLSDAHARGASCEVRLGDGRIVLEREAAQADAPRYDLLAIDAFSSDAIPMHLLTSECFETYWRRLRPNGMLAVHVSNRHVDLKPVVRKHVERAGQEACFVDFQPTAEQAHHEAAQVSNWILITGNRDLLASQELRDARSPWPTGSCPPLLWTDDFSNLFQVLR
jgi:spermidine synthase